MWCWQGESAIVVTFDGPLEHANAQARAAATAARARRDVTAATPGARTVLAHLTGDADPDAVARDLQRTVASPAARQSREHRIGVVYDGDDLAALSREIGLSEPAIVALHAGARYTVAFLGFMPGFAYLLGLPPPLRVPRLETPRTRVPAGSVAIAGEWAGVYPTASPGGWRLLGRTDARLFDPASGAALAAGDHVHFEAS